MKKVEYTNTKISKLSKLFSDASMWKVYVFYNLSVSISVHLTGFKIHLTTSGQRDIANNNG